jgi:guanylate kinase
MTETTGVHSGARQILFVVSGPSGSGKETVMNAMVARIPALSRIITYTTRAPRTGELPDKHYHFVSESEFEALREQGELFESEAVYGSSRYGSPRRAVEGTDQGDLIMELDPHGFMRMRKARSAPTVGIFLLVPNARELQRRITSRAAQADLQRRLQIAREQLVFGEDYDYLIVNDERTTCLEEVATIIRAERLRRDGLLHLARVRRDFGS